MEKSIDTRRRTTLRAFAARGAMAAFVAILSLLHGCASHAPVLRSDPSYGVVARSRIGGLGGWDFITFESSRQRLFIARSDRVQVWSALTQQLVGEIPGTAGVHGVALAGDLQRGFTSNGRANSLTVFDLADLRVVGTLPIPGDNPDAILYESKFKRIYTFNGRSNDATVVDAVTLEVLATIPLGGKPEVAVSDGSGHVFVNIEDTAELVAIDQATDRVYARWPLAPCQSPTGLAIDSAHRRLFSVCANRIMTVVDADSGGIVASVPIGSGPDGAEFDPALSLAFSANGDGTLTVVHEDSPRGFTVVGNVATQNKARTLTLDPLSHRVYLVSALFGPAPEPTAAQPRPRLPVLPDTFTVIVAAPRGAVSTLH